LSKYTVNDDDLIISSITINGDKLAGSVDLYPIEDNYLVAIEPLFDILGLKYEMDDSSLSVWKKGEEFTYNFNEVSNNAEQAHWANDGYYQFIDLSVLHELFEIESIFKDNLLSLEITTNNYHFPVTVLREQKNSRYSDKLSVFYSDKQNETPQVITIPDEYQLFTLPHGQINGSINHTKDTKNYNVNAQIVSDFLYHSMTLNINKNTDRDVSGGLTLSKYKSSPNERLLGVFDRYSFGDISGLSNELVSNAGSGVGIVLDKKPDNYRRSNNEITIEEQAPPGWDVELYHNNRYVDKKIVPQTGRIIFKDVLVEWGANTYELRLYGPFGEEEMITKNYSLDTNPLSGGDTAYGVYVLDPHNTVFNNRGNRQSFELDNYGMSFDYGITDTWQVGLGFNQVNSSFTSLLDDEQILSFKNFINLPGMLIESNFAMNNDDGYAQLTSVTGNLASRGRYYLSYTSAEDFKSGRIFSPEGKLQEFQARYSDIVGWMPYSFNYLYRDDQYINSQSIGNTLSYSFEEFRLSNTLTYNETELKQTGNGPTDNLLGTVNLSTSLFDSIRITGSLHYQPEESDFISDSSSLSAQWSYRTESNIIHNINFKYLPITAANTDWSVNYNASWVNDIYRLSLSSFYAENNNWSVGINFSFFLGYDYHNNRALMSSNLNSHSATLHVDTYLDRQLNGIRDPLDYPIEGASFVGNNYWSGIQSSKDGYTTLPGVHVRVPLRFRAMWQNGGKTINNDYVIYTHPGASINVNMPFYLETELAGFVYTQSDKADFPAKGIEIQLIDKQNTLIDSIKTDSDGYYEFLNVKPNQYTIRVSEESLLNKRLNSDVIGYKINTPATGGFIEFPDLLLSKNATVELKNEIVVLDVEALNEPLIWSDDEQKQKNYFLMPLKNNEISAPHQVNELGYAKTKEVLLSDHDQALNINAVTDKSAVMVASTAKNVKADKADKEVYVIQLAAYLTRDAANEFISHYNLGNIEPMVAAVSSSHANYQVIYKVILNTHDTKVLAENFVVNNAINEQDYLIIKLKESDLNLNTKQLDNLKTDSTAQPLTNTDSTASIFNDNENTLKQIRWAIQYSAGKSLITNDVYNEFGSIAELYQGTKVISATNEIYFCLLSKSFNTKSEALAFNARSLIKGWLLPVSTFEKIIKVGK